MTYFFFPASSSNHKKTQLKYLVFISELTKTSNNNKNFHASNLILHIYVNINISNQINLYPEYDK